MISDHDASRRAVYRASLPLYVKVIGVFLTGYLLYTIGGGLPPWPWKQLFRVLGGGEAALPFSRILVQSLAMLVSWLLLLLISLQMLRPKYRVYSERMQSPQQDNVSSSSWTPLSSSEEIVKPTIQQRTTEKIEQGNLLQGTFKEELVPVQDRLQDNRKSAQTFSSSTRKRARLARQIHGGLSPADNTASSLVRSRLVLTSQQNAEPVRFETENNQLSPVLDGHLRTSPCPIVMLHGAAVASLGTHHSQDGKENCLLVVTGVCAAQTPAVPYALFVISDGSVYERAQQTTCRLAIDTMSTHLLKALAEPLVLDSENIKNLLIRSVKHTNTVLYKRNQEENESRIATIAGMLVLGDTAYVTSVGDSRAYLYRSRAGLVQISLDHLARQSKKGITDQTDLDRNLSEPQVYRALGLQDAVLVDTFRVPLEQEDILLLTTNGAWKYVHRTKLAQLLTHSTRSYFDPAALTTSILHASIEAGGSDNAATIVARIKETH